MVGGGGLVRSRAVLAQNTAQEDVNLEPDLARVASSAQRSSTSSVARSNALTRWWLRNVFLSVPHQACRDHLANERTVLSYIRTAQAFAQLGVVIAQLLRLQNSSISDRSFFDVSLPLAGIFIASAIVVSILGCSRFFNWQRVLVRGQAVSSGWEMLTVFCLTAAVSFANACETS